MKNKPTARLHHYLPQSYLGHFTNTGRKDGKLYVLDINTGRTFRPTPKNIAAERDFNRVDIDGHSPDVIENALAEFEDKAIQAIRNTIATKTFPASADCNLILNLICLIAVRNPKLRKSFNNAKESALHMLGELLVSDEKIWNHHLSKALESGYKRYKRFL